METIHIGSVRLDIFKEYDWTQIPKELNISFRKSMFTTTPSGNEWPDWKAVIVCKVLPYESCVTENGYVVIDVSKSVPDVVRLGLFWDFDNAVLFAKEYCKNGIALLHGKFSESTPENSRR